MKDGVEELDVGMGRLVRSLSQKMGRGLDETSVTFFSSFLRLSYMYTLKCICLPFPLEHVTYSPQYASTTRLSFFPFLNDKPSPENAVHMYMPVGLSTET